MDELHADVLIYEEGRWRFLRVLSDGTFTGASNTKVTSMHRYDDPGCFAPRSASDEVSP